MSNPEQAVRDTAKAFGDALAAARDAGLFITWPMTPAGLKTIAISETRKALSATENETLALPTTPVASVSQLPEIVTFHDGDALTLNLTDEERAALPALDPDASNDPSNFIAASGKGKYKP